MKPRAFVSPSEDYIYVPDMRDDFVYIGRLEYMRLVEVLKGAVYKDGGSRKFKVDELSWIYVPFGKGGCKGDDATYLGVNYKEVTDPEILDTLKRRLVSDEKIIRRMYLKKHPFSRKDAFSRDFANIS